MILLGTALLAACNLPTRQNAAPTGDPVSTQVSLLLTSQPTPTPKQAAPGTAATLTTAPSATPIPTLTPVASPTASAPTAAKPSPTTPAGDPKNSLGQPSWHDTAEVAKSFYLFENEGTKVTAENGALVLTGLTANGWLGWSLTYSHPAQNFYIEAVFNPQTCSGADQYGLVFRAPDADSGYFFTVTCDGKYNLHAHAFKDNTDTTLIPTTPNAAILSGANQTNRLGVMATGEKISLYANGVLLQEINDATYNPDKGNFGALIAANATPGFTVKLVEISLWKLP